MNRERAKTVLMKIERINQEIELLGNLILRNKLKPLPIPVKQRKGLGIK